MLPNHACNPSLLVLLIVGRAYKLHGPQRIICIQVDAGCSVGCAVEVNEIKRRVAMRALRTIIMFC